MDTLCWFCDNACGGCSWSGKFEPVPGWIAIPTKIQAEKGRKMDSFTVLSCPEFSLTEKSAGEYEVWRKRFGNGHDKLGGCELLQQPEE